ncbi:FGGY-family carbohydrate kinase [Labrenzia sp. CE80]|uniref:FGGY-family carbohydrate kinase n=1 Tax=Labrenzia sp. CE80 TaxID=1788986 RepID=UPI00129A4E0A|nr:FGGY-family carbohydrate kinase [Labrenzia sp. CE80]
MKQVRHVAVIDIGKTNAKVAVVDLNDEREIGVMTRPNHVRPGPPYPHYDIEGHWTFICNALADLHRRHRIDAVSVTTHGASIVLLDSNGDLAAPVLDYEFKEPDNLTDQYDAIRPDFGETGSPRLKMGLNVGAQLFWQLKSDVKLSDRIATVLTYPQYWAFRLSGIVANEVTSLGCHTDLWCPKEQRFSDLVQELGLSDKMAPIRQASDCLGPLLPQTAAQTGLPVNLPVYCGIHDSNASLYPHLLKREPPFSIVSTGTWVITFAVGGSTKPLDAKHDTLINVNAWSDPVPSARFMGGREYEMILEGADTGFAEADVASVLDNEIMLFPAVDPRSGPFQGRQHHWSVDESSLTSSEKYIALSFYLALTTAVCLEMTGADGPVIVEGPFTRNQPYLDMLQAATARKTISAGGSATGTSIGAALLAAGSKQLSRTNDNGSFLTDCPDDLLRRYATRWFEMTDGTAHPT